MNPKILFVNEASFLSTGYSNFHRNIMLALQSQGIEVEEFALCVNANHPNIDYVPWILYPNLPITQEEQARYNSTPHSEYGSWRFEEVLLKSKPTHVFCASDSWHWEYQTRSPLRKFFSHIGCPAIDNPSQNEQWLQQYQTVDAALCYTEWGCNIMREYGGINVIGKCSPIIGPNYRPIANKKEKQLALGLGEIKVIGMVARNQPRKLFPDLFEMFSMLLKKTGRKDVYLYLHTDAPATWELDREINKYGVGHRTLFTYICTKCNQIEPSFYNGLTKTCGCGGTQCLPNGGISLSEEQLSIVYNLMDIYVQMANTEGFGLPIVEAASCGVIPVSVGYSSMEEVCSRVNGINISPIGVYQEPESGRKMAVPNKEEFVSVISELLSLPSQMLRTKGLKSNLAFTVNYGKNEIEKTIENLKTAISRTKPLLSWNDRSSFIVKSSDSAPTSNDLDFAKWLICEVLCEPWRMGTLFEARLVRDLQSGFAPHGFGGLYYNELTAAKLGKDSLQPFNREIAYTHFRGLVDNKNYWEQRRLNVVQ